MKGKVVKGMSLDIIKLVNPRTLNLPESAQIPIQTRSIMKACMDRFDSFPK